MSRGGVPGHVDGTRIIKFSPVFFKKKTKEVEAKREAIENGISNDTIGLIDKSHEWKGLGNLFLNDIR